MKTIKVQIDATDKYCGGCNGLLLLRSSKDVYRCYHFTDKYGNYIKPKVTGKAKLINRCKQCLEAEVKE